MTSSLNLSSYDISKEVLEYRLENLIFSQNMLNSWKRDKEEFIEKYIRNIFWSDDSQKDRDYEENMSYGREFHLMCQRIFLDIPEIIEFEDEVSTSKKEDKSKNSFYENQSINKFSDTDKESLKKIKSIKEMYIKKYGDKVVFKPECTIELKSNILVNLDLLVEVYDSEKLIKIDIWDWKVEKRKTEIDYAIKRMQTMVYMYVCKMSLGENLDFEDITMHYYQPIHDNNVVIKYNEQLHTKFENEIKTTISEIKNMKWEV
ncbi:PD-(D/E)XK nuclease family protein [Peptostreptococcus faecalis]|uniref:PD-(D/E)XK nuclease family protein n=1 Tax=Peptostreptococcus faecalis TaxID=2045015 RepID=UPI000C79E9CC|nr:PD-(D/E)XK nuclease family protein [Peptostreptococcus faecalis]